MFNVTSFCAIETRPHHVVEQCIGSFFASEGPDSCLVQILLNVLSLRLLLLTHLVSLGKLTCDCGLFHILMHANASINFLQFIQLPSWVLHIYQPIGVWNHAKVF